MIVLYDELKFNSSLSSLFFSLSLADLETVNGQDVSVLDLTHTFVPPSGRGKGIAKILCDAAFEFARLEGVAIRPSCSYLTDTYLVKNDPGTVQIV